MRIAYCSTFYPFRGGIAQFNENLLDGLQKNNQVLPINFSRQYPDFLFPGTSQYEDNLRNENPKKALLDSINPFSYLKTTQEINHFAADKILTAYWMSFFAPSLGTVLRFSKAKEKKIGLVHNIIPHEKRFFDKVFNNYYLNANDAFIVLSHSVERDLKTFTKKPIHVHPHPIYEHFGEKIDKNTARERLGIPQDKKVLLFFGLIRAYKGLDVLIEAFNSLSQEYFLLIAGECYENIEKYNALIQQNKNKENIKFFQKYIPDDEVAVYFSASDLNVLPYYSATQSGVIAVAYHFDLPVLVSNVGSLGEDVERFETGLVIEYTEKNILKKGIERFFNQFDNKNAISNILTFKERYNWHSLADLVCSI